MTATQRFWLTSLVAALLYVALFRRFMLSHATTPWFIHVVFWLLLLAFVGFAFFRHGERRGATTMAGLAGGFIAGFFAGHGEYLYSEAGALETMLAWPDRLELALGLLIRPLLMFGWFLGFFYGLGLENWKRPSTAPGSPRP